MVRQIIGVILVAAVAAAFLFEAVRAVITGVAHGRGNSPRRAEEPFDFWSTFAWLLAVGLFCGALVVGFGVYLIFFA